MGERQASWSKAEGIGRLVHQSGGLLVSQGASSLFGMLFWFVAARTIAAADVGISSAVISTAMIVLAVARIGLDNGVMRLLPTQTAGMRRSTLGIYFRVLVAIVVPLLIFSSIVLDAWLPALSQAVDGAWDAALVGATAFALVLFLALHPVLVAMDAAWWLAAQSITYGVLRLAVLLAGLFVLDADWRLMVGASLVAFVVSGIAVLASPPWRAVLAADPEPGSRLPDLVVGSSGHYFSSLLGPLPMALGTLLVTALHGSAAAAVYYLLWQVGQAAMVPQMVLQKTGLTHLAQGHTQRDLWRWPLVLAAITTGALVVVAAAFVMAWLGDPYATIGLAALLPFALSTIPAYVNTVALARLRQEGRDGWTFLVAGAPILVFLGLFAWSDGAVLSAGWFWLVGTSGAALAALPWIGVRRPA